MYASFWHSEAPEDLFLFESQVEVIPRKGDLVSLACEDEQHNSWFESWMVVEVTWSFANPSVPLESDEDATRLCYGVHIELRPPREGSEMLGLREALAEVKATRKRREKESVG